MPKKKAVDSEKLIKMVKDEAPQGEIMDVFGFKTSTQLKTAYMNALMEKGMIPAIKGGRGRVSKKKVSNETSVGKRGSIIIPKDLVEEMGFVQNNRFLIKKTKMGIVLKRLY